MKDRLEFDSEESPERWQDFLRELEERVASAAGGEIRPEPPPEDDPWRTPGGDPIDPVAFFVTFTGIE